MNLNTFKQHLVQHADQPVGFAFSDGEAIPGHFHVTEVGHIAKKFIDCGGTLRESQTAQLQVWLGGDEQHRLTAGKLGHILELASPLLPDQTLEVEIEYEACAISQYPVESAEVANGQLVFRLGEKHTDCLAKEACGVEPAAAGSCCGEEGCCQ